MSDETLNELLYYARMKTVLMNYGLSEASAELAIQDIKNLEDNRL